VVDQSRAFLTFKKSIPSLKMTPEENKYVENKNYFRRWDNKIKRPLALL